MSGLTSLTNAPPTHLFDPALCPHFNALPGVLVDIKDTIKGFNQIIEGEFDHLPEAAFNLVGTIEEAVEKGERLMAEAKS